MAFADITLADGQATPVNHTFSFLNVLTGKVVRGDTSASAEEPILHTIGHQSRLIKGVPTQSHLVRFDWTVLDEDGVTPYFANSRQMIDLPDRIRSDALAKNMAAFMRAQWTEAFILQLIRGSSL